MPPTGGEGSRAARHAAAAGGAAQDQGAGAAGLRRSGSAERGSDQVRIGRAAGVPPPRSISRSIPTAPRANAARGVGLQDGAQSCGEKGVACNADLYGEIEFDSLAVRRHHASAGRPRCALDWPMVLIYRCVGRGRQAADPPARLRSCWPRSGSGRRRSPGRRQSARGSSSTSGVGPGCRSPGQRRCRAGGPR